MSPELVFAFYVFIALMTAAVALLWGSQEKILGAGLLLGSIVVSNIVMVVFVIKQPDHNALALVYASMDLMLAYCFLALFKVRAWRAKNRWAGVLAIIHLVMAFVNLAGKYLPELLSYGQQMITLNFLVIVSSLAILIGSLPKSLSEMRDVLRMKWTFFINDFLGRVSIKKALAVMNKDKDKNVKEIDLYVGQRVRTLRKGAELAQWELAEALGVSQAMIAKVESGRQRLHATQLHQIAQIFDVSMDFFYDGLSTKPLLRPAR